MLEFRRQMADYDAGETDHHPLEFTPDRIRIVNLTSERNQGIIGEFLSDVIAQRGYDPIDVVCDLIIEERGHVDVALYTMDERDVEKRLRHPLSMIGSDGLALAPYGELSQGCPHPRSYGTFPRFLGHYVRDRGIMDMATAINKCTARCASRLNITDRGLLKRGYRADVTVFDPAGIIDRATFEDPHQYPLGIEHVIVNGELTVSGGEHTGAAAGLILANP